MLYLKENKKGNINTFLDVKISGINCEKKYLAINPKEILFG